MNPMTLKGTPCTSSRLRVLLQSRAPLQRRNWFSSSSTTHSWGERDVVYDRIPLDVDELVKECIAKPQTNVSLQMLMKTGRGELVGKTYKTEAFMGRMGQQLATQRIPIQFASFLRKEIPIRLAHRIQDLDNVPILRDMRAVQAVKGIYIQSFLEMLKHPPIHSHVEEESFAKMLALLYSKHSSVLVQMAKGAYELREGIRSGEIHVPPLPVDAPHHDHPTPQQPREKVTSLLDMHQPDHYNEHARSLHNSSFEEMYDTQKFLDRFYMSRIGIRVLAGQYLALRDRPLPDYVGMICQTTSPSDIVRRAATDAAGICRRKYGISPDVNIKGRLDLTFPYIPTYLHYIILELLKNALRATMEHHLEKNGGQINNDVAVPPVVVIIADGTENEDVVVKIIDEGGGIARSRMSKVWSYLYTTAGSSLQEAVFSGRDHDSNVSPLAGLGYGLPISRSYCRYFGGDISIMSMHGHGTDVFVYMKRLGDTKEPMLV